MKNYVLFFFLLIIGIGCSTENTTENTKSEIEALGTKMYNEKTNTFDKDKTLIFIEKSEKFANESPKDSVSLKYLFKAASMARAINQHQKAIDIYKNIHENFNQFPKAAQALFLQGFILENELKRPKEAKSIYERFLKQYPNNDFAKDAKFLLSNLGKSNEEIIMGFEKGAKVQKK